MSAWHGHYTLHATHFTDSCIWNTDSKIKPKLSETFLYITWAFLVSSKEKTSSCHYQHHSPVRLIIMQIQEQEKNKKRHEEKSWASPLNKQEIVCVIIITRFPSQREIKPAYVTCCVTFDWLKQMYCFNQSNYREPLQMPSECDPCCANKPDFLSKVGLVTDCRQYCSVPMATWCMTNKEIHSSL